MTVPFVTSWSSEREHESIVWDRHLVSWVVSEWQNPGYVHPLFKELHRNRQRRCVLDCLCQICGKAIERGGVISMGVCDEWGLIVDPFTCVPCSIVALTECPELARPGTVIREVLRWRVQPVHLKADDGRVDRDVIDLLGIYLLAYTVRDPAWLKACVPE